MDAADKEPRGLFGLTGDGWVWWFLVDDHRVKVTKTSLITGNVRVQHDIHTREEARELWKALKQKGLYEVSWKDNLLNCDQSSTLQTNEGV